MLQQCRSLKLGYADLLYQLLIIIKATKVRIRTCTCTYVRTCMCVQGKESPLLPFELLHAPAQGAHGGKYQLLELITSLAKQLLSHASVDRIAPVPKEPMARRLTVHKVIESVLDTSVLPVAHHTRLRIRPKSSSNTL